MFSDDIWQLYSALEDLVDLDDRGNFDIARLIMMSIVGGFADELPGVAQESFKIASKHHQDIASNVDLNKHYILAGEIIDGRELDYSDSLVCKIRALLFVLVSDWKEYPDDTPDDLLSAFMDFVETAGVKETIVYEGIRTGIKFAEAAESKK